MKDKIWRVEKTRTIHRDRWINLRADDCVRPDGVEIKPYYVLDYPDWAQVIALTPQEEIVLVRQYRHGMGAMTLELPSGVIDPGDASPEAAGARELLEETGYACDSLRLVGFTWNNPASCTNKVFALLGEGARPVAAQNLEATEDIVVETMPLAQAVDVAASGGFAHCAQVASLFMALRARGALG